MAHTMETFLSFFEIFSCSARVSSHFHELYDGSWTKKNGMSGEPKTSRHSPINPSNLSANPSCESDSP